MVNQSSVNCGLRLDRLDGESRYLNIIRDAWLEYRPVPRTQLDSESSVSMRLKCSASNDALELKFPDLSGESFRLQWTTRQFTTEYDAILRDADGGILFIHPESIVKPLRIDTVNDLASTIEGALAPSDTEQASVEEIQDCATPWDIEKAPTQVQLVELLQFINSREHFVPPFRLAIIVSAWDLVENCGLAPSDWITDQLPLLRQFLDCNREAFDVGFYGVSAQGGRYPSSLLSIGDFLAPERFAKLLSAQGDPVTAWIWNQFDNAGQTSLQETKQTPQALQLVMMRRFNQLLVQTNFYEQERFKGIKLRSETRELLNGKKLSGEENIHLNRMLLEDVYPDHLSRNRLHERRPENFKEKCQVGAYR